MRCLYFPVLSAILFLTVQNLHAQCPTIDAGEDLYLCVPPGPANLNGSIDGPYLDFMWTPPGGLVGTQTLNPAVVTTQNATYVLKVRGVDLGNNLITNGDFESGNTGFWSDYLYSPGDLWPEGVYDVLPNPQAAHANFAPCPDHTSGSGNMMAVNGAGTPNLNVWCQTVPVTPNTDYAFSAWVTTLVASSPAFLQFSINGSTIGPIHAAPASTCVWTNFYTTWNSGANASATICIVNQNTVLGGNDFALDDIVFSPICVVTDTVRVYMVNIQAVANPPITIIPCEGAEISLNGTGSSTGQDISYFWETSNGNIVSGATTLNPVINAAGTYTLTVTFNNGLAECTKTATVSVIESPNPLFAWIDPPNPIGCGSTTSLLIGHSSQPGFSSYQWTAGPGGNFTSGTTGSTATVNQPGEYTLLVTNTNTGCTSEASVTVIPATNPPTAVASSNVSVFNCSTPNFTLNGAGSSTGNNIAYAWAAFNGGNIVNGATSQSALADAPGTYVLTVTNTGNGCTAADTLTVVADLIPPVVTIQAPGIFTCNADTLSLSGSVNSPASTTWTVANGGSFTGDSSLLTIAILTPGTYILQALNNANFCWGADTVVVGIDTLPPTVVILAPDTITCQQATITLSGAGSSVGLNFSYQWTAGSGGNIVSGSTTLNPEINAPGSYTLLVTNTANACRADSTVFVVADADALVAVANAPDTLSCADTLVVLNADGSSAIPGLIYTWTTTNGQITAGAGSPTPTVAAPGSYQLLLSNPANGCTATDNTIVEENTAAPNLNIGTPDTLTCANPSLSLQGQNNGPGTSFIYLWTASNGGNIVSGNTGLNPLVNAPGSYILTATNLLNGCTAAVSTTVTLEAGTPVAIAAVPGPISCANPTQTLNTGGSSAGPGFSFNWTTTGGNFVSGQNSPNPVVDAPGAYALTVTNLGNGCTATAALTVLEDIAAPPADAGPDGLLSCTAPVFSLSANNGQADPNLQFSWETNTGSFSGNPDSIAVNTTAAGTYFLTVLNTQNGCLSTDSVSVTANQTPPTVGIPTPAMLNCIQLTSTLNTVGGNPDYSYQWATGNGQFVSGQTGPAPVVDAPGLYTLVLTDTVNGCTSTHSVTVQQDNATPQADAGPSPTLTCAQAQAILQGTVEAGAGIVMLWTSANGNIVSGAGSPTPTVDQPGDYQLLVTNTANGCTNSATVSVLQNIVAPAANAGADDTLSCALNTLDLGGSGSANGTAAFSWTAADGGNLVSGSNSLNPVIDAPGLYILLVTDLDNGCTATDSVVVVNDAAAPAASASDPAPLTCAVTQLDLPGSGSTGPNFSYAWSAAPGGNIVSGANTLNPVVNAPGLYTLTVTNLANGCTATAQSAVGQNTTPPAVQIQAPGALTCTVQSLTLSGSPTGANFSFSWQTSGGSIVSGGQSPTPVVNQPGQYSLLVTDQTNGCTASASVLVVSDMAPPVISVATPGILTCTNTTINLSGAVGQPATGFSTVWATVDGHILSGQNSLTPVAGAPGSYVLTVQNLQNGCTASTSVLVGQNIMPPVADAGPAPTITCADPQVALDGSGSTGQGSLSFSWSGGQIGSGANSAAPVVLEAAGYTLTVTDAANGCTATDAVLVLENTVPPDVSIVQPLARTCARDSVVLDAGSSSGGPGFSLSWSTANGQFSSGQNSLTPLVQAAGVYVLTIQNQQNGCSSSATVTVLDDLAAPNAEAGPGDELHCNNPETTLNGSSSTAASLSFAWSSSGGGTIVSGAAGPNPVVNSAGTYLLTVTNTGNGCSATDAATVTEVLPPAFTPQVVQPNCHQTTGSIAIGPVTGGVPPFRYSRNGGQQFQPSPAFGGLAPGSYTVVVADTYGCTAEAEAVIEPPFVPELELTVGPVLELGDSLLLEPVLNMPYSQVAVWHWTPAEGLSCTDCPTPWARPFRPTIYRLAITDQNGCTAEASVVVQVDRRRNLYAPTIFSPNGDGENDRFLLFGRGVAEIQTLRIFDRWGNQLFLNEHFQPNEEAQGWDGRYRGQDMNPGVFVWQAVIEFVDGAVEVYAGDVTLYR